MAVQWTHSTNATDELQRRYKATKIPQTPGQNPPTVPSTEVDDNEELLSDLFSFGFSAQVV